MDAAETVRERILAAVAGAAVEVVAGVQPSLRVDPAHLVAAAKFIQDEPEYRMDMCTCVSGVDYPENSVIEVVYHFYSVEKKIGPIILRTCVPREEARCECPSLTPMFRGAEYQEREVYDLFGVRFTGHPDLRRILMWDGFDGHPMRKDYVPEDQDSLADMELARRPEDTIN